MCFYRRIVNRNEQATTFTLKTETAPGFTSKLHKDPRAVQEWS